MKRFLLSAALLLACSGVALAQESEFSGGGGGGITAAPGSGTAGRVPQFASTTSLEDSKMTTSGTNKGTWTLYDDTAVTGNSSLAVRSGAGQSSALFAAFANNGTTVLAEVTVGGSVRGVEFRDNSERYFYAGQYGIVGASDVSLKFSSTLGVLGPYDIGLARSAAGILAITDGSTGQGGIGLSDAATATVSDALVLRHATSGTAAASFGTGLLFQGEDAAGNMQDMARISAVYTDASNGSEDVKLIFSNIDGGADTAGLTYQTIGGVTYLILNHHTLLQNSGTSINIDGAPLYLSTSGTLIWGVNSSGLTPGITNTYDIGTSSALVRNIYVAGSIQGANSVTLTAATDDPFVEIAVPVGGTVGGYVEYTIVADDATDYQARSGRLPFSVVNKAGAESAVINTVYSAASEAFAESAGASTLAVTFTTDNATGSNNVRIRANAVSSLTETTLAIKCRVVITSGTATLTFNP